MSETMNTIYDNANEANMGQVTLPFLTAKIMAAHAAHDLLDRDTDPDYSERDAIWTKINAGLGKMIETASVNLAGIKAKITVAVAIESDELTASIFRDVLALAD